MVYYRCHPDEGGSKIPAVASEICRATVQLLSRFLLRRNDKKTGSLVPSCADCVQIETVLV